MEEYRLGLSLNDAFDDLGELIRRQGEDVEDSGESQRRLFNAIR